MAAIRIKKGLNIPLVGAPAPEVADAASSPVVTVYPSEFPGIKPRALVREGDRVKRGSPLFMDKTHEALRFCSPAGGVVRSIVLGPRRSLQAIIIDVDAHEEVESFPRAAAETIRGLPREEVLGRLTGTGLLAFIRERPFSHIADATHTPKAIFVNGMNTAPFQPDFHVVWAGNEQAFQAGLDALTRLTDGAVHLCLPPESGVTAENVERHTFYGPHPAGNSSVHIHHIDPIAPHDRVWVVKAVDVIQIGDLFLRGEVPATKVVCVGGPGVREEARRYYRVRIGGAIEPVLGKALREGEQRIISGDVLSGSKIDLEGGFRTLTSSITIIPEGRERRFLGWLAPGLNRYSRSRLFLSRWLRPRASWVLDTNLNGGHRAMVLTGLYDQVMPMKIMVDYLVRAVLAHDTGEAVQLGLLETDPEDFALCSFVCPSKMDLVSIIRKGLAEVEAEGL